MRGGTGVEVALSCALRIRRLAAACGVAETELPVALVTQLPATAPALLAGMPALTPTRRFAASTYHSSWLWLTRIFGAGEAPLRAALLHPEFEPHDALSYACMSARTLGEATLLTERYWSLRDGTCTWSQQVGPRLWRLVLTATGPLEAGQALAMTSYLIDAVWSARALTAQPSLAAVRVDLPIERPRTYRAYEEFFGCAVRFFAPRCELMVPRSQLELPLAAPSLAAPGVALQQADRFLADVLTQQSGPAALLTRLRRLVGERLDVEPELGRCARTLGVSPRTLQRRLQQDGCTFSCVIDQARIEQARYLLLDQQLSIEEVAHRVGFSEAGALHRVFRRLHGATPSAFRRS